MSLMQLIARTINSERKAIVCYLVNTVVLMLIYNLMPDSAVSIAYPLCVSIAILVVYLAFKANALHRFYATLDTAKVGPDFEYEAENGEEKRVFDLIVDIHAAYHGQLAELNDKLDGRNALFSRFIHNMKSSLAVIELACAKQTHDATADIALENEKLQTNMEQLLNLLRLDEFSNDYVPERVDLLELVQVVINDKRREFIYARVFPKLTGSSAYVYTDRKWCAYMLEQIITNAIKYSKQGNHVYFEIESDPEANRTAAIRIRDEGEGIEPDDLPRVFELFFTGRNGRTRPNATGIGLAMVKHIARRLGHEVSLTSEVGTGTTVTFTFLTKMQD